MAQFLKRRESGSEKVSKLEGQSVSEADGAFFKKYPALSEFLDLEEWEPGQTRERGTMTLFFEQGAFKAAVNDRDSGLVAFVSKQSFQGLLEAIEKGLQTGSLDWRAQKGKVQGRAKRP